MASPGLLPIGLLIGLVIAFYLVTRYWRPAARLRQGLRQRVSDIHRGVDAGAPPSSQAKPVLGDPWQEVVDQYHHDPRILRDHVMAFLDQDDGEERLRLWAEEFDFPVYPVEEEPEPGEEHLAVPLRFLVCSPEQLAAIPANIRRTLYSKRSQARFAASDDEAPTRVVIQAGTNGHAGQAPVARKGRRPKEPVPDAGGDDE